MNPRVTRRPLRWLSRLALASVCACAAKHVAIDTGPPRPAILSETQGVLAIQEALTQAGVLAERGFALTLEGRPFQADLRFANPPFAIEWLSADERKQAELAGTKLPTSTLQSALQIAAGESRGSPVQMLVLDAAAYVYEANPLLVQRGARGIEDAERRVRHDVDDFLSYCRDQGAQF